MHDKNPQMAAKLAELLADTVAARFIYQGYHWNVVGPDFGEYHDFYKKLYEDLDSTIDEVGENILKCGFPAPYLLRDFIELCPATEERLDGTSQQFLLQSALRVNSNLISKLYEASQLAEECNEWGLMDFLAKRIDMHKKWAWQIKAYLGVR